MKNLTLFAFFTCMAGNALIARAQESVLKITYTVNTNRSVDFNYEKTDPGTYTVVLNFNNLTNAAESDRQVLNTPGYAGRLFGLNPANKEQGIGFSYRYSYIRGKLKPRYNPDFVYLLPYKKGTTVRVAESAFVNARYFGSTTPDDWKVYRFYTDNEDTVTAVRKGLVVSVKDLYATAALEAEYTSQVNEVIVEHADGTLATYRGFKKGSIGVKVGQTVFPGTAIGVNSANNTNSKPNVSLLITYLKQAESTGEQTMKDSKSYYGFITPKFFTTENAAAVLVPQQQYTIAHSPEIIKKEFTKKELKLAANIN